MQSLQTSGLIYRFSRALGLCNFDRYERLIADAARLPVAPKPGSRNQLPAGTDLS